MKHDLKNKVHDNYIKTVVKSNMFRHKVEVDKTKYTRKAKHKNKQFYYALKT